MPLAVTHVLSSSILVDLYRDYIAKHKKYFTIHTIFIAGFFGLLPDIDLIGSFISEFFKVSIPTLLQHRSFTHTPFFAFIFLIPAILLWYRGKHKFAVYFFVGAFAIMVHIMLDFFISGNVVGIMFFFPFSLHDFKFTLIDYELTKFSTSLDAILLLAWLWHEEMKHKISDFI